MKEKGCILLEDGLYFKATFQTRESSEEMIANWAKYGKTLVIRDYGVAIHWVDPGTHEVLRWDKVPGWSVWG